MCSVAYLYCLKLFLVCCCTTMQQWKSLLVKHMSTVCLWTGQVQSSMMPFTLSELVTLSRCLRDACLGIIKLAYPETKTEHREEYMAAFRSVGVKTNTEVQQRIQAEQKRWVQLFKVWNLIQASHCSSLYIVLYLNSQMS